MQKNRLALLLLLSSSTLLLSGCNSTTDVWDKFTTILSDATPFLKEGANKSEM